MTHKLSRGIAKRGGAILGAALVLGLLGCGHKMSMNDGGVESDLAQDGVDASGPGADLATKADAGGGGDMASAVVCTSMTRWTPAAGSGPQMRPGGACISCHQTRPRAPKFTIAGTVYATLHEPDDCNGGTATAVPVTVEITDANNKVTTLTASPTSGNFSSLTAIPLPYTAVVKHGGRTRAMKGRQMSGDCNSCHTEQGANGAPGRIQLP